MEYEYRFEIVCLILLFKCLNISIVISQVIIPISLSDLLKEDKKQVTNRIAGYC